MIRIKTRTGYVFFYPPLGWHALASMIILIYLIFDSLSFGFASVWSQKQLALVCTTPKYRIFMSKQSHGVHHFRVRSMPGKRISPLGVTAFQTYLKILQFFFQSCSFLPPRCCYRRRWLCACEIFEHSLVQNMIPKNHLFYH